jgi:hypothetical protein
MNKYQIAVTYANAVKRQVGYENQLAAALGGLGSTNQVLSTCEPIQQGYSSLVYEILGKELYDGLECWMWELDFGTSNKLISFTEHKGGRIQLVSFRVNELTLYEYLKLLDV